MSVVKEVIITINYYSPRLKKHRYSMDAVGKKERMHSGGGTGVLYDEIIRRDQLVKGASGVLDVSQGPYGHTDFKEPSQAEIYASPHDDLTKDIVPESKPKRQFRVLKKVEDMIFDDTPEKLGKLEEEADQMLNADGYYDEILPLDSDEEVPAEERPKITVVVALVAALFVLGFIGIKMITGLF